MIGTLGGLKIELSKEELLWLVQNSNGNGNGHSYDPNAPQVGGSYGGGHEPHGLSDIPLDEQSALEEALNGRNPGAFMDREDLVNEANAARAAYAGFALNGAAQAVAAPGDQHEGVPVFVHEDSGEVVPPVASPATPVPQAPPASV